MIFNHKNVINSAKKSVICKLLSVQLKVWGLQWCQKPASSLSVWTKLHYRTSVIARKNKLWFVWIFHWTDLKLTTQTHPHKCDFTLQPPYFPHVYCFFPSVLKHWLHVLLSVCDISKPYFSIWNCWSEILICSKIYFADMAPDTAWNQM